MFLGIYGIDEYVSIPAVTHRFSSGAAYAPSAITYSIYEEGNTTGLDEDVDMTPASPFDGVTGLYLARRQLTAAAGFEAGKTYVVVVKATVDSVAAIDAHVFQVRAIQTGDAYARLGAPAGASVSADVAAVKSGTAAILTDTGTTLDGKIDTIDGIVDAIKAKTDNLPSDPADQSAVEAAITAAHSTTNAKVDAVDDYIDTEVAAILADTNELQTDLANGGRLDLLIDAIKAKTDNLPAAPAAQGDIPSANAVADQVWDELLSGHTGAGSAGNALSTASSGGVDPSVLADAIWDEAISGHQSAGTAGKALADANNGTPPTAAAIRAEIDSNSTQLAAIVADTAELQTDLVNGGRLDLLIDAIKAKTDGLPADPADQSAVEAAITAAYSTTNAKVDAVDDYIDTEVAAILADTNELQTDLANGGRLDLLIDGIKAVTDKLNTTLELDGAVYRYTENALEQAPAGTGGGGATAEEIREEIDANSTKLAAIKAKTDTLAGGSGAIDYTYTVTDSGTGLPIADVTVWASTDAAGANIVASGLTDSFGAATFHLDAGTYYFWRQKSGYDFANPDTEAVS